MSVTSSVDSRVILDSIGAESLMGRGDLLYKAPDKNKSARLQGSMVSQEEVIRVVNFIKSQVPEVQYATSILEPMAAPNTGEGGEVDVSGDNMFEQAVRVVVNYQKGSSSFLQRKLNIGFNRAARLLEEMEEMGIVGPSVGGKPREVLISDADEFLSKLANKPQG
jgi:S-DNA-T family DNA segregation ATPase FtsK/SpoIIIE